MHWLEYVLPSWVHADGVQLIDVNPGTREKRRLSRDLGGHPDNDD